MVYSLTAGCSRRGAVALAQVTGDLLAGRDLAQQRSLDLAAVEGVRAAGVEAATAWRVHRARHVALQHARAVPDGRIGHRHRSEQRLGIGMARPREDRLLVGDLDDAA